MKQQVGIGITLAFITAMCRGALPIAVEQVPEMMEPPTMAPYYFPMASTGFDTIFAIRSRLPPLRIFRKPHWLVLLAITTGGLFDNSVSFSPSPQYLSSTAPQVIG